METTDRIPALHTNRYGLPDAPTEDASLDHIELRIVIHIGGTRRTNNRKVPIRKINGGRDIRLAAVLAKPIGGVWVHFHSVFQEKIGFFALRRCFGSRNFRSFLAKVKLWPTAIS